jgi:hypothetical protein
MQALFPVPRLSESFLDEVVRRAGGQRFTEVWTPAPGMENPDYVFPGMLAEAKILEEEGLRKVSRQLKLAKLLESSAIDFGRNDFYDQAPPDLRRQIENLLLEPIQRAAKKAGKQLAAARALEPFMGSGTTLIAVNSGYSSLPADLFESLVLRSCKKDTSQIDCIAFLSLHYHQGRFDSYIFLRKDIVNVRGNAIWHGSDAFMTAADNCFEEAMTIMMRDQMNPALGDTHLPPVQDILFESHGVTYVREAPIVPNSSLP